MKLNNVETWNPSIAMAWIDRYIEEVLDAANDLSEDVKRLRMITALDLSHPELFRAFVRGACGFDVAKDCSMIFFLAACIGDYAISDELEKKHRALWSALECEYDKSQKDWEEAQDAFMSRQDVIDLIALFA